MPINITLPADQFFTLGGRIACKQCQAKSKRSKQQCRAPAMRGKQVCKNHGGKSTGPKTIEGRKVALTLKPSTAMKRAKREQNEA
jgi:hypothetical protein